MDEGVIKFHCEWTKTGPLPESEINEINLWRNKLHALGLIGVYREAGEEIGFGNISVRIGATNQFIVSGTQTGGISELNASHYTKVIAGDFAKHSLKCEGPTKASSESLTHLAIYEADQSAKAIIHTHHKEFWQKLLNRIPTTRKSVTYGTPEMAEEMFRLFRETDVKRVRMLAMAGHDDGVVAFGASVDDAGSILMKRLLQENILTRTK